MAAVFEQCKNTRILNDMTYFKIHRGRFSIKILGTHRQQLRKHVVHEESKQSAGDFVFKVTSVRSYPFYLKICCMFLSRNKIFCNIYALSTP